ncbi:MAG: UDP-N-acetylmuramoyl-L-alanyl-D-glutamate--2,6-diaminopimelate ligase [Gemmatimonadota bacterium]
MVSAGLPLEAVVRRLRDAQLLLATHGPEDVTVTGVSQDSRKVSPGDLFLAWKGADHDAHDYVVPAVEAGAVAVVVERPVPDLTASQLQVSNGRLAGALAADSVLGSPWTELFLAGITGTNGKTTVAVLVRHLLGTKWPSHALGTLGLVETSGTVRSGTEGLTTPGPVQISRWLREMADDGVSHVAMEASSHALAQYRLDGTRFDAAVFTNLSQDHLDYHADLEDYRLAKSRILNLLKPAGWAVVNRDDAAWEALASPPDRTLLFGIEGGPGGLTLQASHGCSQLLASDLDLLPEGSRFRLNSGDESAAVTLPLLGRFNVENELASAGVAWAAGMSLAEIARGLSSAPEIPGRLERITHEPVAVLIDFAHTPDALERVLNTLRPLVKGRLLVLFGAGGDRDRGKRPRMGDVVSRLADLSFVTSDNPRTEDPEAIIDDIVAGVGERPYRRLADRRNAIAAALAEARPGDLLLLAGKGHETYQVLGREQKPFDERAIVRELLGLRVGESRA